MVLFGAYHTAERFPDDDRLTAHFRGPGSYVPKSEVEGAPVPRYAETFVEDGCLRPDGSTLLFRERDSWVRGVEGPKGLASLSVGNAFISPTVYSAESGEHLVRERIPAAFFDTGEARYLSPSTRCLTPNHEQAAKGTQSPGPGRYYPFYEAWDFAPPEKWNNVNKAYKSSEGRFKSKTVWGDASMPRPPVPARAEEVPSKEEREWLTKRRGSIRPSTSPRCMWVTGVCTRGGLQAWGDLATKVGPIHVGHGTDCGPPLDEFSGRRPSSERRGPVHSCEERATGIGFREVRYLDRELTRRGAGAGKDTPGPGEYCVRPTMKCGTTFAGPPPKCSRATAVTNAISTAASSADVRDGCARVVGNKGWPTRPPIRSQRMSAPLVGGESPGPAYNLPSDFDRRGSNKKTFHPPPCKGRAKPLGGGTARKRGRRAGAVVTCQPGRRTMSKVAGARKAMRALASISVGVPVKTSIGLGVLSEIRADGMSFVRLPWGVLHTMEMLSRS